MKVFRRESRTYKIAKHHKHFCGLIGYDIPEQYFTENDNYIGYVDGKMVGGFTLVRGLSDLRSWRQVPEARRSGFRWIDGPDNFFDNKTRAGFADTGIQANISSNTNTVGVCLTPVEMNYRNESGATFGRGSYLHDTWCAEGIRTLLTGKFL